MYLEFVRFFNEALEQKAAELEEGFACERFFLAYRYALLAQGKRLRPYMLYLSVKSVAPYLSEDELRARIFNSALAVEMVHTYSLVHDDLPAMDNDDWRRGKPTCHRQFDEATAILVGDALIADAFLLLSSSRCADRQVACLARAIGSSGMVLGQALDLGSKTATLSMHEWLNIHALKTGRLFAAACELGAVCVGADSTIAQAIGTLGQHFGMAFQLRDDIADAAPLTDVAEKTALVDLAKEHLDAAIALATSHQWQALGSFLAEQRL